MSFTDIQAIVKKNPQAKLIVVAKNREIAEIQAIIKQGANNLAFNRIQEAKQKFAELNFVGKKHLIGHLQRNKAKIAVQMFDLIHSLDSWRLAEKLNQEAAKIDKIQAVLLQVNISADTDKFGFSSNEINKLTKEFDKLSNLKIRGLMTIGRLNANQQEKQADFTAMNKLVNKLQPIFGNDFTELSMGMSNDFELALNCGATMVRVGRNCFTDENVKEKGLAL